VPRKSAALPAIAQAPAARDPNPAPARAVAGEVGVAGGGTAPFYRRELAAQAPGVRRSDTMTTGAIGVVRGDPA